MAFAAFAWPPEPSDYYLPASPRRPLFQGDVFDDIPLVKAKSAGSPDKDPNLVVERRLVALVGYPCDTYANGKPIKVQTIAPVTAAQKAGIPPNWDGAFTFSPLIDLRGDGVPYAVDLRAAANIDASYLTRGRRIRSLSEFGWAVFRQRRALCDTRAVIPLDALRQIGEPIWQEFEAWQRWCESGRPESNFQSWLDERERDLSGFTRRAALERGMYPMVRAALERALAS